MSRNVFLAAFLFLIAIASAPLFSVAKWIGYFDLTVNLDIAPDIDASSIRYVECRNDQEASWLARDQSGTRAGFEPPDTATPTSQTIAIKCTGDSGGYGLYNTYHQPAFLVVQYRKLNTNDDTYARKKLAIPLGRGSRSTTLTLP